MRGRTHLLIALVGCLCLTLAAPALAATDPLENAYWRLEEGVAGNPVAQGENTVLDSINLNDMMTVSPSSAPVYTSDVPVGVIPQTGATNNLAMRFSPNQDVYTSGKIINYPIIKAFTVEAAFKLSSLDRFQGIVGKDGKPTSSPLQPLVLKVRDSNELQIETLDGAGTPRGVRSLAALEADQWYYAAVVHDGSTLSLWLDRNDGAGYVLQGTDIVTPDADPLYETDSSWAIGRGMYDNGPADWFDGIIDEVRLSNTALDPSEFLFVVPEPASLILLGLGSLLVLRRRV